MVVMTILSPVMGDGTPASPYRPKFGDDFPVLSWSDVTGRDAESQPGDPELVAIEVMTDDPGAIYASDDYFVIDERPDDEEGV